MNEAFDSFLRDAAARRGLGDVAAWRIRPHRRRSTFDLTVVDVATDDSATTQLVCKSTSAAAVAPGRRAGVRRDHHPAREAWCYEHVLDGLGLGTPAWWGTDTEHRWLLLESVAGVPLSEVVDQRAWAAAARWLADFHASGAAVGPLLPRLDSAWIERNWSDAVAAASWAEVGSLVARRPDVERAAELLADEPQVVVHGEWFPSNVVVDPSTGRVCPVDWETAAVGPAAVDLAAMTAGWSAPNARRLVDAYAARRHLDDAGRRALDRSWAAARVAVAVGHLADLDRTIPLEHRHDWGAELVDATHQMRSTEP